MPNFDSSLDCWDEFFLDILHQLLDRNRKTRVKSPNTKNAVYDAFYCQKMRENLCQKLSVNFVKFVKQITPLRGAHRSAYFDIKHRYDSANWQEYPIGISRNV
ncbi:hypothetical protein T4C_1403 [Trichinella pseudospiralis]|uniref:Uncharacterized protein n=1 Tax=Trichinella pseudospiralis TaxID=6337 RepID=A0A0V1JX02_TRIPS|nr:hypothetical protein T4C_1403 [Trichinella pseudospiralis]